MASTFLENLLATPNLPALIGGIMLFAAGLVLLIASRVDAHAALLARRVAAAQPSIAFAKGAEGAPPSTAHLFRLLHLPVHSISEASKRQLVRHLFNRGILSEHPMIYFVGVQLLLALILGALSLMWARNIAVFSASPLILGCVVVTAAFAGWFIPRALIAYSVKQRTKAMRSGLPDALELLVVCIEAGLTLEDGLNRVVKELRQSQPALSEELGLTLADIKILPSREEALAKFAERIDIPSARAIITTLVQTLRYGTPLAKSLRVSAAQMRDDYLTEMEERGNRLPAYLTLPVMLLLMPTIFLIVGGPVVLRMIDNFPGLSR